MDMGSETRRILLVEDEKAIRDAVQAYLERENYWVTPAGDGQEALDAFSLHPYDLVILDRMLPQVPGDKVCRVIRDNSDVPIIMLTAKGEVEDRIIGLELGADDYLIKPFSFDELSARLRVMTRKKYGEKTGVISVGDLTVDTASRRVERAGREISLSAKEYELLCYLAMNKGIVLSREKIENHIWNYDYEGGTNVVDVYIRYLRKKIDEGEQVKLIHTVRGAGYVIK